MSLEFSITSNVGDVLAKIDSTTKDRMTKAAMAVQEEAFRLTNLPGKGREYRLYPFKRKYRASAPGDPPAVRHGILHKTIKWSVEGSGDELEGLVGSEQKYAPGLEYGTENMAPRPWLRPAFENSSEKIRGIFTMEWFK